MPFDVDTWQRTVFESLRGIDPKREFNVATLTLEFEEGAVALDPAGFPGQELAGLVDDWLDSRADHLVGGDSEDAQFHIYGTRITLRARRRSPMHQGWQRPSLRELEEPFQVISLDDGSTRSLLDLDLDDVEALAAGRLRREGVTGTDGWFQLIADTMMHLKLSRVIDADPMVIETWAASLGLISAPPHLGPPRGL
jgi:hypothetical protein